MPQIARGNPFSYEVKLFQPNAGNGSLELLNAIKCIAAAPGCVGPDFNLFPLRTYREVQ